MKRMLGLIVAGVLLLGTGGVAAGAQRPERPPQSTKREGKKRPPGPIVREEKRRDGNAPRGERRGDDERPRGERPPRNRP